MPKFTYRGPYDEFRYPNGPDVKVYHRGDSITLSKEERASLSPRILFDDDTGAETIVPAVADLSQIQTPQNPPPPQEEKK